MIGGFLGAGKTTAVAALAQHLTDRGQRVGLITNDQSTSLVDTAVLRARGFSVEEIAGGCFCCRFDSLSEAAHRLTEQTRPDVFVAEPVGSCTDLVATVSYPLRRIYGDRFTVAPLSVMVDPDRAARILGLERGRSFSDKVVYVYEKQLEEADLIVVNKVDRFDPGRLAALRTALEQRYPGVPVLSCSARRGEGLATWFEQIEQSEGPLRRTMALDYDAYAEGEALLGWLNATVGVTAAVALDGNRFLVELAAELSARIEQRRGEIAHLKMTLDAHDGEQGLSLVSLVHGDQQPDLRESLLGTLRRGTLIINLRAEAPPETLEELTRTALERAAAGREGLSLELTHVESFRPAEPQPTHRISIA
jgi:G3E family GTPase